MTDIRIYDFNFNLLCIMSDVVSSSWSIKYNGIGTYEGHFRINDRISDIILSTPYMIIVEGTKQAVCTGKIADKELLVCGRTLNFLLSKRVMPPFKTKEIFGDEYQDTKTIIDYILTKSFISPPQIDENGNFIANSIDPKKVVENFNIIPYTKTFKLNRHFWRISANTLNDIIHDLTQMMDTGYTLKFNTINKTWDFEILSGTERKIVISEQNHNFYNSSYTEDIENYACSGWYETSYEDTNSDSQTQSSAWNYITYNDGNEGMLFWESVLGGIGDSEALSSLNTKNKKITVRGTVSQLVFEKDYNLGDILTIHIHMGNFSKKIQYKITGINIWRNESGFGEEPIFKEIKEE